MALGVLKWVLKRVDRIEIIMEGHGRMYSLLDVKNVEMYLLDNDRTIKLFMEQDKEEK
jgi:hypothetical protein